MKFVIIATLSLLTFNSYSNEMYHKDMDKMYDNMSLEDAKKMKLEMLDKKLNMIDESRKCVNSANDKIALRNCMKEMRENKKEMHNEMKEKIKKGT